MVIGPVKASKFRIIREFFLLLDGVCLPCPIQPGLTIGRAIFCARSIGLDSGCVYGRRLSALVVPIGNNSSSSTTSPLGKALVAPPNDKLDAATSFAETETEPESSSSTLVSPAESAREEEEPSGATSIRGSAAAARPNSQPNWHGGLNRVKLSPPGSSSSAGAAADDADNGDSTSKE